MCTLSDFFFLLLESFTPEVNILRPIFNPFCLCFNSQLLQIFPQCHSRPNLWKMSLCLADSFIHTILKRWKSGKSHTLHVKRCKKEKRKRCFSHKKSHKQIVLWFFLSVSKICTEAFLEHGERVRCFTQGDPGLLSVGRPGWGWSAKKEMLIVRVLGLNPVWPVLTCLLFAD